MAQRGDPHRIQPLTLTSQLQNCSLYMAFSRLACLSSIKDNGCWWLDYCFNYIAKYTCLFLFLSSLLMLSYNLFPEVHACYGECLEVRGQLAGAGSLLPPGGVLWVGGRVSRWKWRKKADCPVRTWLGQTQEPQETDRLGESLKYYRARLFSLRLFLFDACSWFL